MVFSIFSLFLIIHVLDFCKSEFYSSMVDVESLLNVEQRMTSAINDYIAAETARIERLQELTEDYRKVNVLNQGKFTNPLDTFLLIERLITDWTQIKSVMVHSDLESNTTRQFPNQDDLDGASNAIFRIQDTYKFSVADMVDNQIFAVNGKSSSLTIKDCFDLGQSAYNQSDFYHTVLWMQETLDRLSKEKDKKKFGCTEADVLDYLAFALYKQGNIKRAINLTERLKALNPRHPQAASNIEHYKNMLTPKDLKNDFTPKLVNERVFEKNATEAKLYEMLCRGEHKMTARDMSKLFCYYKKNTPFLKLAPLKAEIIHLRPKILIFRQFLSDLESDLIVERATPKLKSAEIRNDNKQLPVLKYRTAKSAWLKPEEHPIFEAISRRQEDLTDLSMSAAEMIQVANYGIGGHYGPHYDFAAKEDTAAFKHLNAGNRIATVLIYLSQPVAGGATVFTDLKLTILPTKNDALFWYNLLSNGSGDFNTRHASCPVISGIKWVTNRWIHERDQEFRRPCHLNKNDYE